MTKDEILRMAREAQLWEGDDETVIRFANIVAAHDRERVARWQIGSGYATGHGDTIEDLLKELEWQVRESEREQCARVCDGVYTGEEACGDWPTPEMCAAAIRARGQQ
jgi:hypothetical protein